MGVVDVNITGSGWSIGGLVGQMVYGCHVTRCYTTGAVSGSGTWDFVGGLVGMNGRLTDVRLYKGGTLMDCYSIGQTKGSVNVGGLVGWNYGTVTRCYSNGLVSGDSYIGGLVGGNSGDVTQCYSTGPVTGVKEVGGLVGTNYGHVSYCYSTGSVIGNSDVGGLVGSSWIEGGLILTDCYSTGSVSGESQVGGLVGVGFAIRCYSTGPVSGTSSVGGLIGSGIAPGCFWDIETSGQATSADGTGLKTSQMHDPNTFMAAGWDFAPHDVWFEPEGGGYPILWWQLPPGFGLPTFSGGNGEPNDPYRISTPAELNGIGHNPRLMGAHFELVNDIDLAGIDFYIIGNEFCPFTGSCNGNAHTISHLTISGRSNLGLICQLGPGAEVRNLGVVDVNIVGSGSYVGALVGRNYDGRLDTCYSTGTVSGSKYVGGLVGCDGGLYSVGGVLTGCYSTSTVSGTGPVGGLVGSNHGTVAQCYSTGAVSGTQDVGGLVGGNYGDVTNCYSSGTVSGTGDYVGGLVGYNSGGIATSYSAGTVTGDDYVGGLVGYNYRGSIATSYSSGSVTGRNDVGGLVGSNSYGSISTSYSTAVVMGTAQYAGGLVGHNEYYGRVTQCYSTGAVTGRYCVGGLVGWNRDAVTASFWDIQTSVQGTSAGGTGKTTAEMQTAKTFLDAGWDFVGETTNGTEDIWWILEGQDYPRLWWENDNN